MTTDWTFEGTWPFAPRWFDGPDGRMHYVDEGQGDPVVLVHGNPTWGYLYRHFIPPLVAAGHRVVVPDHLGFGRSDKPDDASRYTIARHCARLESLLESLDLQRATLAVQDWGGFIGLYWASRHPERIARLFIMNTFAHRPRAEVSLPLPLRLFRVPGVGELLVKGLDFFKHVFMFRAGVVHHERMTPVVRRAYLAPHPSWSSRTAVLVFPREIPAGPSGPVSDLGAEIEQGMERHLRSKPVKIVWAMKDIAFVPSMVDEMWLQTFPDADVMRIPDAGHYLQEDAHEQIVPALLEFLGRRPDESP